MSNTFDQHSATYRGTVEKSVDFSGKDHDFFMAAKARVIGEFLKGHFATTEKLRGLDVGCGIGALHPHVEPFFSELTGADISADSIARARTRRNKVNYVDYKAGPLPFADNSFDFTFTVCVVHHVPVRHWQDFVSDLARVTRSGGAVCIIEHNPLNPATRLAVLRCPFDEDAVLLGSRKTKGLMRKAGLQEIAAQYFLLSPFDNKLAHRVEKTLSGLALGAQYATFGTV